MFVGRTYYKDTEKALKEWLKACAAGGPEKCSFSALGGETAEGISAKIEEMLSAAYHSGSTTLTFSEIAINVYHALYSTSGWTQLSEYLTTIAQQPGDSSLALRNRSIQRRGQEDFLNIINGVDMAIYCGDSIDLEGSTTEDMLKAIAETSQTTSPHFASVFFAEYICHRWTTRAAERLSEPLKKPKNAILVIGNDFDPITPLSSARRVASSELLGEKARLVRLKGIGHTSGKSLYVHASYKLTFFDRLK